MVTWTTNLAASSQVVYGPTTDYGQATTYNGTMVTSHSVTLTNLTTGVQYHYKCQSRLADGTAVTTPDATFSTDETSSDTTPPTVAMTAPNAGATVSGSVMVSADASDDVAVASVQFLLDGNSVGSPVTAAPYNFSWNTSSTPNGNHTVSAVATDTSGNAANSAGVTVAVSNVQATPLTVAISAPSNGAR